METKKPKIILSSWTKDPDEIIALAVSAWASDHITEDKKTIESPQYMVRKAISAFHQTALEYVNLVFVIKNVSRAFQQQLTRTRQAAYSIQSMRVVLKKGFAENGHYTMPPNLSSGQQKLFKLAMLNIQHNYENLLDEGIPTEDARGILPLNIHSDITMTINLRALYHMTKQRLCLNTQWEYRQVVLQMRDEIEKKLGKIYSKLIKAPCIGPSKCVMGEEFCGIKMWEVSKEEKEYAYENFPKTKKYQNNQIRML